SAAHDDRNDRRAVRDDRVHGGWRAGYVASPVLHRHADRGHRARRELLGARGRAARLHRLRGVSHLQAGTGDAVDAALSLADHVLHSGGVLESRRRRPVRLPDQSAAAAVLHAGTESDAAPRAHGLVRRVRIPRYRADAVLPTRPEAERSMERRPAAHVLLDVQHRPGGYVALHAVADRRHPAQRSNRSRLLVRALRGAYETAENTTA